MHVWTSAKKDQCERRGGHDWQSARTWSGRRCRDCGTTINSLKARAEARKDA